MIKIISDSTCDLTEDIVEKYDIGIVPLTITINGKTYRERVDLTSDQYFAYLNDLKEHPTTSMPSPSEYISAFEEAVEAGYKKILCICMSSGSSGSYQSAAIARNLFLEDDKNSDIDLYVLDSMSMSHGSGWLIKKTAQLREEGYSFEQLIDFNESNKKNVKHLLYVDDLDNVIKSGRLENSAAFIGKLLQIKPIMTVKDSEGVVAAKIRGRKRAMQYYVDEFKKRVNSDITDFIIMGYSTNKKRALDLLEKLKEETDFKGPIYIMQMGVTVGTHVGQGGLSMFFVEKEGMSI